MIHHTLAWFNRRIGKRIFRLTKWKCCAHCASILREGLIVGNERHAHYLKDVQDGGETGFPVEYSDKKKRGNGKK